MRTARWGDGVVRRNPWTTVKQNIIFDKKVKTNTENDNRF
jgi:hypothetical protein